MRRLSWIVLVLALLAAAPSAQEIFTPGNGVTPPAPTKTVKPDYTEAAKAARIEGSVILQAVVQADGTIDNITVTQSLDAVNGLDEQAVKALRQWEFKPGTKDGKPVAVRVTVETKFRLE